MKSIRLAALSFLVLFGHLSSGHAFEDVSLSAAKTRCENLASNDFTVIPDAPTQITSAALINATTDLSAHCRVRGYIVPNIGIALGLPANWNGKLIEMGCGGHCGLLNDEYFTAACAPALKRGYACIISDMGHTGRNDDALWAYNNLAAKLDWGIRAAHVTALTGKALVEHYYGKSARKSYFMGCSTGGRQALQEVQRFPLDFNGVIAIAPPIDLSTVYMTFAWGSRVLHDSSGSPILDRQALKLVTDAAVAKCDLDDGVKDGIIGDPLHCAFDPEKLTCGGYKTSGCLTEAQVEAINRVYAGPMNSKGEKLSLGGPAVGSELGDWDKDPRTGWGFSYIGFKGELEGYQALAAAGFRFLFFWPDLGPTWKLTDFDFDRDSVRMGVMETLYDSSNPDLRNFNAAGGKLLVFQGLNDNSVLPRKTIDYYETVERTLGGRRQTQNFFRLFLLPGVGHCAGGPGADTIDYLTALEDWVEKNSAPDRLVATHLRDSDWKRPVEFPIDPARTQFTRPIYPYPIRAKYKGYGNVNNAENFTPVEP